MWEWGVVLLLYSLVRTFRTLMTPVSLGRNDQSEGNSDGIVVTDVCKRMFAV